MIRTPLSTVIGGAFWTPGATVIGGTSKKTFNQLIQSLFANNEQGFFYDLNDLSTMFQDSTGTIPVTAAGQPVGLMLDKRLGLVRGPELFRDAALVFAGESYRVSPGVYRSYSSAGAYNLINFGGALTVGGWYELMFTIDSVAVVGSGIVLEGATAQSATIAFTTVGRKSVIVNAAQTYVGLKRSSAACDYQISGVSIRALAGNHAYQTTSAARPVLQRNATTGAYYLAFDGADDFLQTNNIDFATDKVSLFTGVTKLADSGQIIAELSPSSAANAGSFYLMSGTNLGGNGYMSMSRGSLSSNADRTARNFTYPAPDVAVLSIKHDISGDLSSMRRNGIVGIDGLLDKGTGNFGNYPLFIGRRGGTALPFNGHIYSLIGIGKLASDSETIALEKAIAKNTGVTLNA